MPVTRIQQEHHWSIRLEGELHLNCAAELKQLLLEGLAAGKNLELDLENAAEIDVVILQLLCAAGREATRRGLRLSGRSSAAVCQAVRDAGFDQAPGFPILDRA